MGRIFPRLQGVKYLFSKYFDVWKASTSCFVCLSNVFTALVKYHHLNTFRSGGKRGLGEQRNAPMQVGQKARARETPAAKSRRWRRNDSAARRGSMRPRWRTTVTANAARPRRHTAATANATRPAKGLLTFRSTSCTSCHCRKGMDRCGRPSYTTHRDCGTPACWMPKRATPLEANRYCPNVADR